MSDPKPGNQHRDLRLGKDLLAGVSRSFYVTLRFLPARIRPPLVLGYLLARASDTLADDPALPGPERAEWLAAFRESLHQGAPAQAGFAARVRAEAAPRVAAGAERRLLEALPDCFGWLEEIGAAERREIVAVLEPITQGQWEDCRRFGQDAGAEAGPRFFETAAELERYTFLVAGCVGVFWTRLCFLDAVRWLRSGTEREVLERLGERYGKALQLINILRDLPADLEAGRCYLPRAELAAAAGGRVLTDPVVLTEVARVWEARCGEWLEDGRLYVGRLRSPRLRLATVLPLLLAWRTLALLRRADWEARAGRVKVGRSEVRRLIARAVLACRSAEATDRLCRRVAG